MQPAGAGRAGRYNVILALLPNGIQKGSRESSLILGESKYFGLQPESSLTLRPKLQDCSDAETRPTIDRRTIYVAFNYGDALGEWYNHGMGDDDTRRRARP